MLKLWIKESWDELCRGVKYILKVKDMWIAILFLANVVGGVERIYHGIKYDKVVKSLKTTKDSCSRKIDSCNTVNINQKYGN